MPIPFKNRALGTDARIMSDTVVSDTPQTTPDPAFILDGDAPRLGAAPAPAPAPSERPKPMLDMEGRLDAPEGAPTLPAPVPQAPAPAAEIASLPVVSPVLTSEEAPSLPASTPNIAPIVTEVEDEPTDDGVDEPRHPMAHLMPQKSKPTEASIRAAEIRAAQKAKGKKIKIGIAVGSLVFTALVGPPLFRWLSDAVNEAGSVSTEQSD